MTAPTDAPDETPNVYGSASGLRNNPWKEAPATAKELPTSKANSTLGNLMVYTMFEYMGSTVSGKSKPNHLEPMILTISNGGIDMVPIEIAARTAVTKKSPANPYVTPILFCKYLWIDRLCNFLYSFNQSWTCPCD